MPRCSLVHRLAVSFGNIAAALGEGRGYVCNQPGGSSAWRRNLLWPSTYTWLVLQRRVGNAEPFLGPSGLIFAPGGVSILVTVVLPAETMAGWRHLTQRSCVPIRVSQCCWLRVLDVHVNGCHSCILSPCLPLTEILLSAAGWNNHTSKGCWHVYDFVHQLEMDLVVFCHQELIQGIVSSLA
jgi:hypothetical protein